MVKENKKGWLGVSKEDEYYKWCFQESTFPIFIALILLTIFVFGLTIYGRFFA